MSDTIAFGKELVMVLGAKGEGAPAAKAPSTPPIDESDVLGQETVGGAAQLISTPVYSRRGSAREPSGIAADVFFEAVFSGEPKIEEKSRLEEFVTYG